jgi:hypothetical protein
MVPVLWLRQQVLRDPPAELTQSGSASSRHRACSAHGNHVGGDEPTREAERR